MPEFLLGFHYVGMIDQTTGHMIELNLQFLFPSQQWGHSKVSTL